MIDGNLSSIECQGHTLITTLNSNTVGIPARGLEVPLLDEASSMDRLGDHWQSTLRIRSHQIGSHQDRYQTRRPPSSD